MCFVLFNNSWFCESIRHQNLNFAFLSCHWGHQIRLLLKTELLFLCGRLSYVYFKLFVRQRKYLIFPRSVIIKIINLKIQWYYTLNVRSRGKQLVLFSRESWCFPRRGRGKHRGKTIILLDFHFNSIKRITGANQNSRLGTYSNTNLILKTTEWMIYKVPSLYYLHHFPPLAAVSLLVTCWITLKIVAF